MKSHKKCPASSDTLMGIACSASVLCVGLKDELTMSASSPSTSSTTPSRSMPVRNSSAAYSSNIGYPLFSASGLSACASVSDWLVAGACGWRGADFPSTSSFEYPSRWARSSTAYSP